jgi:hypothetical protein
LAVLVAALVPILMSVAQNVASTSTEVLPRAPLRIGTREGRSPALALPEAEQ